MIQTILTASLVFISTSIDYLFILLIIFSQSKTQKGNKQVYLGQYLGTGILVGVSLLAAYVLNFIPQDWVIGLLGLIPLCLGIRYIFVGEEEAEEEDIVEKIEGGGQLFWAVTLITIASGGDNLGIYIPYFASLSWVEIGLAIVVFALAIWLLCALSNYLTKITFVEETLEKYERIIVPLVFIALGLYIMVENGTIQTIFSFIP